MYKLCPLFAKRFYYIALFFTYYTVETTSDNKENCGGEGGQRKEMKTHRLEYEVPTCLNDGLLIGLMLGFMLNIDPNQLLSAHEMTIAWSRAS